MENSGLYIWIKWIHLLATAAWIGGMMANLMIYMPVIRKQLDPGISGKLMGAVMGRFKIMVYSCMAIFVLTGVLLVTMRESAVGPMRVGDPWFLYFFLKLALFVAMVFLAVYAFEVLAPAVGRAAAEGPSEKLKRLQRRQGLMALLGFVLGLIILLISSAL
ncbi:MAG: CopD family protein [Bacteroidales bacterium]